MGFSTAARGVEESRHRGPVKASFYLIAFCSKLNPLILAGSYHAAFGYFFDFEISALPHCRLALSPTQMGLWLRYLHGIGVRPATSVCSAMMGPVSQFGILWV